MIPIKFSRKQLEELYSNDEACLQKLFLLKYSHTKKCAKCDKPFKYHKLKNLRLYSCQFCGWNIAPTANTIFHKSGTSLTDWLFAIYLESQAKNGISAKELQRHLGCTYKTAWRIAFKIRSLMKQGGNILSGTVEADETYVGGKMNGQANKNKNKGVVMAR